MKREFKYLSLGVQPKQKYYSKLWLGLNVWKCENCMNGLYTNTESLVWSRDRQQIKLLSLTKS
jgi:hypothetical protein